jgi:hypothetical protein
MGWVSKKLGFDFRMERGIFRAPNVSWSALGPPSLLSYEYSDQFPGV